jgi:hypothetical protein
MTDPTDARMTRGQVIIIVVLGCVLTGAALAIGKWSFDHPDTVSLFHPPAPTDNADDKVLPSWWIPRLPGSENQRMMPAECGQVGPTGALHRIECPPTADEIAISRQVLNQLANHDTQMREERDRALARVDQQSSIIDTLLRNNHDAIVGWRAEQDRADAYQAAIGTLLSTQNNGVDHGRDQRQRGHRGNRPHHKRQRMPSRDCRHDWAENWFTPRPFYTDRPSRYRHRIQRRRVPHHKAKRWMKNAKPW